jgi:hypothetical protein
MIYFISLWFSCHSILVLLSGYNEAVPLKKYDHFYPEGHAQSALYTFDNRKEASILLQLTSGPPFYQKYAIGNIVLIYQSTHTRILREFKADFLNSASNILASQISKEVIKEFSIHLLSL